MTANPKNPRPKIRLATQSDLARILPLIEAYYAFDSIDFDARVIRPALSRLLRDKSLGRCWVVDAAGSLAGYTILTYNYDLEFGGTEGIITEFFIAPNYRREGLGASMISAVREFCRSARIGTIELQVSRGNRRARAFYQSLGFEASDRIVLSIDVNSEKYSRFPLPSKGRGLGG
jgi:diamine N-acetyltransferase